METIWARIETWLTANAPEVAARLNPPATAEDIAATERLLGVMLPDDVKATYLRHDGSSGGGLFDGREWLSLDMVRHEWKIWKDLLDGGDFKGMTSDADGKVVSSDWWNAGWVPFTSNGGGDNDCVDMAPGPKGKVGQIIEMWHDDGKRAVLANNFREWLGKFADALEAGEYAQDEYGGIIHHRDR